MGMEEIIKLFNDNVEADVEKQLSNSVLFQEAIKITMEMNNSYHTPEELRGIMARLIGKQVDDTFRLFPPFYTDFGKNITIGKDVFINSGCHFQDQGGITIGDGSLIGHNVVLTTINHEVRNGKIIMRLLRLGVMYGLAQTQSFCRVLRLENGRLSQQGRSLQKMSRLIRL